MILIRVQVNLAELAVTNGKDRFSEILSDTKSASSRVKVSASIIIFNIIDKKYKCNYDETNSVK